MPADLLGPTLEEVQMWLRSASGWVPAGFVLNVEPVNARLGRVLVVEDDPGIATQLVRGLTRAGYETGSVTTGKAALDWPVPDVFLLDLGLPDMDGVEVCRRLRQACDAAIIIVTARGEETDRVLALDEGADDYLIKPFGLQELLARIRAVLRRSKQPAGQPQVLQHGPLTVDLRTHKVSVSPLPPRSSPFSSAWPATRAGWSAARRCSSAPGTSTGTARLKCSTCTWRRCGRSLALPA